MDIQLEQRNDVLVLEIQGKITAVEVADLQLCIDTLLDYPIDRVMVLMAQVLYLSSEALGVILHLRRELDSRGGRVCLVGMTEVVASRLHRIHTERLLVEFDREEEAMVYLRESPSSSEEI